MSRKEVEEDDAAVKAAHGGKKARGDGAGVAVEEGQEGRASNEEVEPGENPNAGEPAEGPTAAQLIADDAARGGETPRARHRGDEPIGEERREALREESGLPAHAVDIQENAVAPTVAAKQATGLQAEAAAEGEKARRSASLGADIFVHTWGPGGLEKVEAAKIVKVYDEKTVNVCIFKENGGTAGHASVKMRGETGDRRGGLSWSWTEKD